MFVWNDHKEYEGKHALFSASGYHWLNYDDETFISKYYSQFSATIGTVIHQLAHECIVSRIKLNKHDVHLVEMALYKAFVPREMYDANAILDNLVPFVNDAIGFRMYSEKVVFVNPYFFGTVDAIKYDEKELSLRIFDLKTGSGPVKLDQLYIYAAEFCIEYNVDPRKLKLIETKIYQLGGEIKDNPSGDYIYEIMEKIRNRTELIMRLLGR